MSSTLHANNSQEEKAASHYVDFLKVFSKSDPYHFYELMMGTSCPKQGAVIYRFGVPGAYEYDERDMGQEPITEAHLGIPFVSQRDSALMTCPQNQISECEHMDNVLDNLQEY